jgi:hypothetical protein
MAARRRIDDLLDLRRAGTQPDPHPEPVRVRELLIRDRADCQIVSRAKRIGVLEQLLDWLARCEEVVAARAGADGNDQPVVGGGGDSVAD